MGGKLWWDSFENRAAGRRARWITARQALPQISGVGVNLGLPAQLHGLLGAAPTQGVGLRVTTTTQDSGGRGVSRRRGGAAGVTGARGRLR